MAFTPSTMSYDTCSSLWEKSSTDSFVAHAPVADSRLLFSDAFIYYCRETVDALFFQVFKQKYLEELLYCGFMGEKQRRQLELILIVSLLKLIRNKNKAIAVTRNLMRSIEGLIYSLTHSSLWIRTMDSLQADDLSSLLYEHIFWFLASNPEYSSYSRRGGASAAARMDSFESLEESEEDTFIDLERGPIIHNQNPSSDAPTPFTIEMTDFTVKPIPPAFEDGEDEDNMFEIV